MILRRPQVYDFLLLARLYYALSAFFDTVVIKAVKQIVSFQSSFNSLQYLHIVFVLYRVYGRQGVQTRLLLSGPSPPHLHP